MNIQLFAPSQNKIYLKEKKKQVPILQVLFFNLCNKDIFYMNEVQKKKTA